MRSTPIRTAFCFGLILVFFLCGIVRIMQIGTNEKIVSATQQNNATVTVSKLRGNIFDCNMIPLTQSKTQNYAVIIPTPQTIMYCSSVLYGDQKKQVLERLQNRKAAVYKTESEMNCVGIYNIKVSDHSSEGGFCSHLLGYIDSSYHGVSGLEKTLDDYLYTNENITVSFATDALGNVLSGIEPIIKNNSSISQQGIMITIDSTVQRVVEKSCENLSKGAVVISEAGSGKIRGMVSRPNFNTNNLAEYLNSNNAPFLNRSLIGYNIGSVFKPCVAAAALNKGKLNGFVTECLGFDEIGGNIFRCHKAEGHGTLDLEGAIKFSCNSYFYRLAQRIGATDILETASVFGFGNRKNLLGGIYTTDENLPQIQNENDGIALTNLSIGQGELLASPVTMLSLYEAIACEGVYHTPTIIEGKVENAKLTESFNRPSAVKTMSKANANKIKAYLSQVVKSGTGQNAFSNKVSVAGKTATAQTGWNENGRTIQHSWFCGFFPVENPKYIVVVLVEDSLGIEDQATQIFRNIAEGLY